MRYFIGIDGGGTGTRAVLIDGKREVMGRGTAGPSSHYVVGPATAAQNCAVAVAAALDDARRMGLEFTTNEIPAWGFGLAGVRRPSDHALMHGFLSEICPRPFSLETDVVAAHAGAFSGQPGVVLSAGTGAICFGADEYGEKYYADGWGPLMGDEGGGYWIGIEALRAVCRSLDGRGPQTRLVSPILDALEVRTSDELIVFVHSEACTRTRIASLARIVFSLAEEGSSEAADIRARAAALLALGVRSVANAMLQKRLERAMDPRGAAPLEMLVALRGGLFEDEFMHATLGFAVHNAMAGLKRDFLPISAWKVIKPRYDAAVGAAILAQMVA
jgi:N-acetylglucosamine kinase-like BadF-type ATPase